MTPPPRPPHLQPALLGLVIVGGTAGTAARQAVSLSLEPAGSFPVAIFLINVVGAFALGVLLETLVHAGSDSGMLRNLRLFAGTGFLGGFTTYSALATDTDLMLRDGDVATGILYAGGTLLVGFIAALLGIIIGGRLRRRRMGAGA